MAAPDQPYILDVAAILAANGCRGRSVRRYVLVLDNGAKLTGVLPAAGTASAADDSAEMTPLQRQVFDCLAASPLAMTRKAIFAALGWPLAAGKPAGHRGTLIGKMADDGLIETRDGYYADDPAKFPEVREA